MSTSDNQIQAERGFVLKDLLLELGGLAHENMTTDQLDHVLDNMLTKTSPSNPSVDMQRWVHTHRNNQDFKIYQILGAHVAKISSLVPECFGKFHDPKAAECRACLDRTLCSTRTISNKDSDGEPASLVSIKMAYTVKALSTDAISDVLSRKRGQIAQALHHGSKVTLTVVNNKLRVLSMGTAKQPIVLEDTDMGTKGKATPAPAEVEELDEELEVEGDEEGEELEAEEGEESEEVEDVATEAPVVAAAKVKKAAKPKPVLNKAQQEFQDALNALPDTDAKQKYSQKTIKTLGIAHDNNADARVAHMQRVMAIKKHLGAATVVAPKKAVAKK